MKIKVRMRFFWFLPLVTPLLLAACDPRPQSELDPQSLLKLFDSEEGPDVKGVDATLLDSAHQAEEKREYGRALQFYQQLIDKDKENPIYIIGLANSLRQLGQLEEANHHYNRMLKLQPDNLDALEGKGLCLMNTGEPQSAGDYFQKVMAKDNKRWRTLNAIGILFVMKDMRKEALAYFVEAQNANPNEPAILNNMGLALALAQQYDQSIATLKQVGDNLDKNDPQKKRADLNLALVYGLAGDIERAEEVAGRHLKESALNNNLGFYAYLANNQELAKAYLNNALAGSPVFYEKAWKNLEIVGGSKVERSQFDKGAKNVTAHSEKPPFEVYEKEPELPMQSEAAPVTAVTGGQDLPEVIPDRSLNSDPKKVVEKKKEKKETAKPLPAVLPKPSPAPAPESAVEAQSHVEVFPAVPVNPILGDNIHPVSMSMESNAMPAAMPVAAPVAVPVAAPNAAPASSSADIYLPSEMENKGKAFPHPTVAKRESVPVKEIPLKIEEKMEEVVGPPMPSAKKKRQFSKENMIVYQAGEAEETVPHPEPPMAVAPSPVQAEPQQEVIVTEPPVEPVSSEPERQSTVDYFKSIF